MVQAELLSARNPRVRRLRRLAGRRSARLGEQRFVIEGPLLITEALDAGVDVEEIFVDAADARRPNVTTMLASAAGRQVPVALLARGALEQVADAATPNAAIAVARRRPAAVSEVLESAIRRARLVLVMAGVSDPGNAGTLIRAAAAAGTVGVVACGGTDVFGPKAVRASAGAVFRVPVAEVPAPRDATRTNGAATGDEPSDPVGALASVMAACRDRGVAVVVADQQGEPFTTATLTEPLALVVGNESHGVPAVTIAQADRVVSIPMENEVESLNVAMAGTVLCFEVARRRWGK
ncbi:MAG: RNA methyltransferase [Acidimicrobiales bacterium]|nr:RNA methyltransferase [Acidimicrobiales bacterium]